jgi:hypothetical protein
MQLFKYYKFIFIIYIFGINFAESKMAKAKQEGSRICYSRGIGSRYCTKSYYTASPPPSRMNSYFFLGYPYSYPYSYYYPQMPYAFGYNGSTSA